MNLFCIFNACHVLPIFSPILQFPDPQPFFLMPIIAPLVYIPVSSVSTSAAANGLLYVFWFSVVARIIWLIKFDKSKKTRIFSRNLLIFS
jgi:hypothetical protein